MTRLLSGLFCFLLVKFLELQWATQISRIPKEITHILKLDNVNKAKQYVLTTDRPKTKSSLPFTSYG